jgi:hypothetical protein
MGAQVAQSYSVWLRTGRPGDRGSIPGRGKGFSSSLCVQTGSGAHPVHCTMGTGGPFYGAKTRPGRDADHSPYLVPRSWMSRSYTSPPPCASIGVLWDCFAFTCFRETYLPMFYRLLGDKCQLLRNPTERLVMAKQMLENILLCGLYWR